MDSIQEAYVELRGTNFKVVPVLMSFTLNNYVRYLRLTFFSAAHRSSVDHLAFSLE